MKMSDILRDLAELLDQQQADQNNAESDNTELDPNPVMVPPLQAKLELLKKATGVESVYDTDNSRDELADIKKLTGIKAVVQHEASEDNDITG